jgi:gliding motility-associated-like protein
LTSTLKILFLSFFTLLLCQISQAQFYVSGPSCVLTGPPNPMTGMLEGCQKPTSFFDTDTASVTSTWLLGDGNGASGRSFPYNYQAEGIYSVSLVRTFKNGSQTTTSKSIKVGKFPTQPTFNKKEKSDTTICSKNPLKLDPYGFGSEPNDVDYKWYPSGKTTKTITVDTSGCYSVDVIDRVSGCVRSAVINVKVCYEPPPTSGLKEKWFVGNGGIIEFTTNSKVVPKDSLKSSGTLGDSLVKLPPTTAKLPLNPQFKSIGSTAIVYDKDKKLAFYSDGTRLFSGEDNSLIKNADGTPFNVGGVSSPQGHLIVPKPNCNSCDYTEFYLFKVDPDSKTLSYSIIDKRLNNKKGAVVEQNIPLLFPVSENIIGKKNIDESGFQVLANTSQTGQNHVITVDTAGVNIVSQSIGSISTVKNTVTESPDSKKMARGVVLNNKNYVEIFDLDPITKALSNPILIDLNIPSPPVPFGISFSPNNDLIYVSLSGDPALGQTSYFIQLALFDGTPVQIASKKIIISSSTTETYGAILRGPFFGDGQKFIYLSIKDKNFLPYVQNPDVKGNAVTINYTNTPGSTNVGVSLNGTTNRDLPNNIEPPDTQQGDGLSADYDGNCYGLPTTLTTQGVCSPLKNEAKWFFDDGTSKEGLQVSHTFKKLGWNNVKLVVTVFVDSKVGSVSGNNTVKDLTKQKCTEVIYEGRVFMKPSPTFTLVNPVYLCLDTNEKKLLNPKPKGGTKFEFDWTTSLGTTITKDSVFKAEIPAPVYKLQIKNELGCQADTSFAILEGCDPIIQIPNVFSPNGDSKNDSFILLTKYIVDANLKIFNRWGELVFKTDDPAKDFWDGTFRGKTFSDQMYPYLLQFSSKFFPEKGMQTVRGSVIIIK